MYNDYIFPTKIHQQKLATFYRSTFFYKSTHFYNLIVTTARIKIEVGCKECPTKSIDISDQNQMLQDIFPSERIKLTSIKVSFVKLKFWQAIVKRSDRQSASQNLKIKLVSHHFLSQT